MPAGCSWVRAAQALVGWLLGRIRYLCSSASSSPRLSSPPLLAALRHCSSCPDGLSVQPFDMGRDTLARGVPGPRSVHSLRKGHTSFSLAALLSPSPMSSGLPVSGPAQVPARPSGIRTAPPSTRRDSCVFLHHFVRYAFPVCAAPPPSGLGASLGLDPCLFPLQPLVAPG